MYKQIDQNITSAFVYGYLAEKGYSDLALKLQKCRQIPDLNGLRLEDLVLFHKKLKNFRRTETEVLADQIVITYLRANGHYRLAESLVKMIGMKASNDIQSIQSYKSLQYVVDRFLKDHKSVNLKLQDMQLYHKRLQNSCRSETEVLADQIVIRYLKAKGHYKLAKKLIKMRGIESSINNENHESLEFIAENFYRYNESANLKVSIKERLSSSTREMLEICQNNIDMKKILIFILSSDEKIFEATADSVKIKLTMHEDQPRYPRFYIPIMEKINVRKFSLSTAGPESDESKINKAWKELIEKSKVLNGNQLLHDLYGLVNSTETQRLCGIIGCYLTKYLYNPRHPLRVFIFLHQSLIFTTRGPFDKSEDELILKHINEKRQDLKYLQTMITRPLFRIRKRLERLLDEQPTR